VIHPANTSPKNIGGSLWHPEDPAIVRSLLGDDMARFA
jgi:hypothetical protein